MAYFNVASKPVGMNPSGSYEQDSGGDQASAQSGGKYEDDSAAETAAPAPAAAAVADPAGIYANRGKGDNNNDGGADAARAELFRGQFDGPAVAPAPAPAPPKPQGKTIKGATTSLEGEGKYENLGKGKWKDSGQTVSADEAGVHGRKAKLQADYKDEEMGKSVTFGAQKTHHMNADELEKHTVTSGISESGKTYLGDREDKAIDSTGARPGLKDSKKDRVIYAVNDGQMAQTDARGDMKKMKEAHAKGERPSADREHHSSFFAGKDVDGAGDMKVEKGEVKRISNNSGHYLPTGENLVQTVQHLDGMGINTDNTIAELQGSGTECAVPELKQAGGNEALLAHKHKKLLPDIKSFDQAKLKAPKPSDEMTEAKTRADAERAAMRG